MRTCEARLKGRHGKTQEHHLLCVSPHHLSCLWQSRRRWPACRGIRLAQSLCPLPAWRPGTPRRHPLCVLQSSYAQHTVLSEGSLVGMCTMRRVCALLQSGVGSRRQQLCGQLNTCAHKGPHQDPHRLLTRASSNFGAWLDMKHSPRLRRTGVSSITPVS